MKLNNLVITSFTTIGNGISNYAAQNIGAKKLHRIKLGFRAGMKIVWIISIPLVLIYFFAGRRLLYLFMSEPTDAAVQTGINYLRILSPFYLVISAKLIADGVLRGNGMMGRYLVRLADRLDGGDTYVSLLLQPWTVEGVELVWKKKFVTIPRI